MSFLFSSLTGVLGGLFFSVALLVLGLIRIRASLFCCLNNGKNSFMVDRYWMFYGILSFFLESDDSAEGVLLSESGCKYLSDFFFLMIGLVV